MTVEGSKAASESKSAVRLTVCSHIQYTNAIQHNFKVVRLCDNMLSDTLNTYHVVSWQLDRRLDNEHF